MIRLRAGALGALLAVTNCATAPPPTAPPVPPTPTSPVVRPVPTPPPPVAVPTSHVEPPLVRILLARTREAVSLEQPGRAYRAHWSDGEAWLWGPLRLAAAEGSRSWQVGAFRSGEAAAAAARRLEVALGPDASVSVSNAEDGLQRVRVQWPESEPEAPAEVLEEAGFPGAFAVSTAGVVRIEAAAGVVGSLSGEVVLEPQDGWPIAVRGRRYHGLLRARAVGDELLVINQLNLESYLRGVVPAEMGPAQFPQLDALKAQAVAARTYAVAHLGDHDAEGYDLCATPACQVYAGADSEHPLSDRAVLETAGLIVAFEGAPIDAMYTSTCGGHTEDASLLFSGRAQPYLKGVVCAWDRPLALAGAAAPPAVFHGESEFRAHLAASVLGLPAAAAPQQVVGRVAELCGGRTAEVSAEPTPDELADALRAAGGLHDARALVGSGGAAGLAALADLFDIALEVPGPDVRMHDWHLRAALTALEIQGIVRRDVGEAVPHPQGVAIFPRGAERSEPLPPTLPLYWRWPPVWASAAALEVLPGTVLERYRVDGELLAVVVVRSGGAGEADRRSAWRSWARDRDWAELANRLGVPDLESIEITRRGPSGRVVGLAASGRSGRAVELEGFPIRRALDLPENLFSFHVMVRSDGTRVVRFLGRAWGHGVGLCQNGAYGLARSGMTFDRILKHYYTGVEIVRWEAELTADSG